MASPWVNEGGSVHLSADRAFSCPHDALVKMGDSTRRRLRDHLGCSGGAVRSAVVVSRISFYGLLFDVDCSEVADRGVVSSSSRSAGKSRNGIMALSAIECADSLAKRRWGYLKSYRHLGGRFARGNERDC